MFDFVLFIIRYLEFIDITPDLQLAAPATQLQPIQEIKADF